MAQSPNFELSNQKDAAIFVDPEAYADPASWHAAATRIRAESPILRVDVDGFPPFWAVTTYADVLELERHPEVFTNAPLPVLARTSEIRHTNDLPVKTLVQMDGDEHRLHRAVLGEWFRPASVRRLTEEVRRLARLSIDEMSAFDGRCDFMNDVAVHYPLRVIMAILGLPEADYSRMLRLTQELFGAEDPDIGRVDEDQSTMEVVLDFLKYFSDLTTDRREHPTRDLATVIAQARIDGAPLSDLDTFGYYLIISTAGHDTTSSVIGGSLLALLDHPDQMALLRDDPTLIANAADEFIRYVAPVKHFLRTCRSAYTLRDTTFEPGDLVMLSFASATRDEAVFEKPQSLNVCREAGTVPLGFGFGRHFCLGSHLARLEIRVFFEELLGRLDRIELAGEPSWVRANFVQGPKSIPLTYEFTSTQNP
jgi:cytochrome P450